MLIGQANKGTIIQRLQRGKLMKTNRIMKTMAMASPEAERAKERESLGGPGVEIFPHLQGKTRDIVAQRS